MPNNNIINSLKRLERREKLDKIRITINDSSFIDLDTISQIYNILFPTQNEEK